MTPPCNPDAIRDFLANIIVDHIHLVAIHPDKGEPTTGKWFGTNAAAAVAWAVQNNRAGLNVYWTVNIVRPGLDKKPKKQDIVAARFLHCDVDPPFDRTAVLFQMQDEEPEASFIIDSGNGLQGLFRLAFDAGNMASIEDLNRRLEDRFGADNCYNIDRLLRLPGTVNFPNEKKRGAGRVPVLSSMLMTETGQVVEPEDLRRLLPESKPRLKNGGEERVRISLGEVELFTLEELCIVDTGKTARLYRQITDPTNKDRSRATYGVACEMVRHGFADFEIAGVLLNPAFAISGHCLDQSSPKHAASRAISGARGNAKLVNETSNTGTQKQEKREKQAEDQNERPRIHIRGGDLHLVASAAERALIVTDAPLYIRNGLVRPIVDEVKASKGYTSKVARLKEVDADTLVDYMSRSATWTKYDGRTKADVDIDPPSRIANTILARDGGWQFRRLAGVITTPTLRPDGTILSQEGYDQATQLLLLEPPVLSDLLDAPTKADAEQALIHLDGLLEEFPFVDDASRSVALSAIITPVVRGALESAPMHVTTAPVRGSGKSYIIDIASAVCSGQRAPVLSAGKNEEETEKRVTGDLLTGQALISIDNVNGQLGGAFLCQAVERPLVKVRPLGGSLIVTIESRATFFATGNNILLIEDMTRRVITCSLDPEMELPEFRKFSCNPFQMVLDNRGTYIAAALTIVRAYIVAGKPNVLPRLASYEDWSDLVRSSLVWLGRADPVETMNKANAEDPGRVALSALLSAWYDAAQSAIHTTATIKAVSDAIDATGDRIHSALADALQDVGSDDRNSMFSTKRLGRYLGRNHGRIVDGLKLVAGEDTHVKQKTWKVVRA